MTRRIFSVETAVGTMMAMLVVIVFSQVLLRYLTYQPLAWTEEAARFLFIWICMLGAVVAARRVQHFAVDLLANSLPPRSRRRLAIGLLAVEASFYAFLAGAGFLVIPTVHEQESPSLSMPMSIAYLAIPVAAALIALCQGNRAVRLVLGREVLTWR